MNNTNNSFPFCSVLLARQPTESPSELEIKIRHQAQKIRIVSSLTGGADLLLPNAARSNTTIAARVYDTRRITQLEMDCYKDNGCGSSSSSTCGGNGKKKKNEKLNDDGGGGGGGGGNGDDDDDDNDDDGGAVGDNSGNVRGGGGSIDHEKVNGNDNKSGHDIKRSFRETVLGPNTSASTSTSSSANRWKFDYDFDKVRSFRDAYQHPVVFFLLPSGSGSGSTRGRNSLNAKVNGNVNGNVMMGMRDEQLNQVDSVFKMLQSSLVYFEKHDDNGDGGGGDDNGIDVPSNQSRHHDHNHDPKPTKRKRKLKAHRGSCARIFVVPDYTSILRTLLSIQESLAPDKRHRKELFFEKEAKRLLIPQAAVGQGHGQGQDLGQDLGQGQDGGNGNSSKDHNESLDSGGRGSYEQMISSQAAKTQTISVFHAWAHDRGISMTDVNVIMDALGSMERIISCCSHSTSSTSTSEESLLEQVPVDASVKRAILSFFGGGRGSNVRNDMNMSIGICNGNGGGGGGDCIVDVDVDVDIDGNRNGNWNDYNLPHNKMGYSDANQMQNQRSLLSSSSWQRQPMDHHAVGHDDKHHGSNRQRYDHQQIGLGIGNHGNNQLLNERSVNISMDCNGNGNGNGNDNLQHLEFPHTAPHYNSNGHTIGSSTRASVAHFEDDPFQQQQQQHFPRRQASFHRQSSTPATNLFGQQNYQDMGIVDVNMDMDAGMSAPNQSFITTTETGHGSVRYPSDVASTPRTVRHPMSARNTRYNHSHNQGSNLGSAHTMIFHHSQGVLSSGRRHPFNDGQVHGYSHMNIVRGASDAMMNHHHHNQHQPSPFNQRSVRQSMIEQSHSSSTHGGGMRHSMDSMTYSANTMSANPFQEFYNYS